MNRTERIECIDLMYELYPLVRKIVLDTFNKKESILTRTQQIILLALALNGSLSMSKLAKKINISNEQATRAVAQLVSMNFVSRCQDPYNRRVIHISLTDKAIEFMEAQKDRIKNELLQKFELVSDEDIKDLKRSLYQMIHALKAVED